VEQPAWEGFDEWAHFAFIEHVASYGRLPSRNEPASAALRRAVALAPLSAAAAGYSRDSLTHDEFWRLSPEQRLAREHEFESLRASYQSADAGGTMLRQYEAQQPPLYYLLLAPIYLCIRMFSFPAQIFILRFSSVLIASVGLLLSYKIALSLPASRRAAVPVLLLLVSWPGLLLDVSRIGNDSLALTLACALILSLFRIMRGPFRLSRWALMGIILGAALLAKAYMLAFIPLLPLVLLPERLRRRPGIVSASKGMAIACAIAAVIAGWWYVATWRDTGTLSGEQVEVSAARFGYAGKLIAVQSINWIRVLDSAAATHIWTGGWSFLNVRSWIYRVFECVAALATIGLAFLLVRLGIRSRRRKLTPPAACFFLAVAAFALFCSGLAYSAVGRYLTQGVFSALGWYLYAVAGVEFVLLASGFTGLVGTRRSGACVAGAALLACVFDLYTAHFVSIPYYTGLVAHLPSGAVASFHPAAVLKNIGVQEMIARFAANKPAAPSLLITLWAAYVCVTIGLLAWSIVLVKRTAVHA
jgi:4-amino-4-deoxy-L-arabinose transferase-like glycosyltransferase